MPHYTGARRAARQPLGAPLPQRRSSNVGELMRRHGADRMLVSAIVRQRFPRIPVVLATGYTERQVALPGVQVLAKPYPIEKLLTLLASAAGTSRELPSDTEMR